jgi:signal transduction histidine kinase/ligand-binding sensor domain-containing protein
MRRLPRSYVRYLASAREMRDKRRVKPGFKLISVWLAMIPHFVVDLARSPHAIHVFRASLRQSALLCLLAATAFAQSGSYRFDHWTTDTGLPQNTVRAIVQTRDGYLWLTTFDGLARFDGVRFTVFDKSNTPAITNNRFTALYEDKDGTLWAGAEQGEVVAYRNGVFTPYISAEGPRGVSIANFRPDFNEELMSITGKRAYYLRAGKFIPAPPEYTDLKMKLYLGPSGTRWTIDTSGARQVKDGREVYYPIKLDWNVGLSGLDVYEDSRGNLWVGDGAGVCLLGNGQATRYTAAEGLPPRVRMRPQCEDDDGGVWFATGEALTDGIGVAQFKNGRFTVYASEAGLPRAIYNRLIKDREGSIWVATSSGLFRLRKELITTYSTADGLPHNEVYPMLKTRDSRIWVGTIHGLSRFRNGSFAGNPLPGFTEIVQSLWEDRAGRLWIGVFGSLYRYENGKFKNLTPPQAEGAPVWAIQEDRLGAVWVGTERGLLKFEGGRFAAHYTMKDGLPSEDVKVIHESARNDRQGELWFGTYGGLVRFKDGKFTSYTTAQGLTGNRVRSIYEDSDGTLWIGTYDDGLSRFRDGKFFNYRTEQGLFNNGVFQILEDQRGYFWISCNKGIYRVSRRELNELAEGRILRASSVAFGKQDGMLNSECNGGRQPAGLVTDDGLLWFPTMGGVAVVDPEAAKLNPQPPPVMIEAVTLERHQVDFSQGVSVAPGQRDLEINYTGLSLIKSEQVKFRYRLEGLDADWVDVGTRRVVYFPYLPPGSYRFRIIAANSDGVWNKEGAALDIFVATPFYRAWWFITLAALSLAGIAVLAYRRRFAALRARQEAQEAFSRRLIESQEQERKRLAAELHDSLSQNLVIIKNRAMISLQQREDPEEVFEQVAEIAEAADHALFEVREIAHNLRPFQIDRLGLTKAIEAVVRKANAGALRFSAHLDKIDSLLPPEAEINLYRIIQESVNNIVKHSQATEASVTIKRRDQSIEVSIQDNGRGFTPATTQPSQSPSGSGMGLAGINERARILGSAPVIESAPGRGTKISLEIRTIKS